MGLMTRFFRLCKADLHGVMDQIEDRELLLKQYLREMEDALSKKEADLKRLAAERETAGRERDDYEIRGRALEDDISTALDKEKDDIARHLIRKLLPITSLIKTLDARLERLDARINHLREAIRKQRQEYDQIRVRAASLSGSARKDRYPEGGVEYSTRTMDAEPSDQDVELELLKRKDRLGKGGRRESTD